MSLSTNSSDNFVLDHSLFDFLINALVSDEKRTIFCNLRIVQQMIIN